MQNRIILFALSVLFIVANAPCSANPYDQPNAATPEQWVTRTPPRNPDADPDAPRGYNVIRNGNQLYGTGANRGSGFVKDPIGNWHGTGTLSGKTCIQMPYGGYSCR